MLCVLQTDRWYRSEETASSDAVSYPLPLLVEAANLLSAAVLAWMVVLLVLFQPSAERKIGAMSGGVGFINTPDFFPEHVPKAR